MKKEFYSFEMKYLQVVTQLNDCLYKIKN